MTTTTADLNIIARHATENGWSIMIDLTSEGYTCPVYRISRVAPGGKFLPLATKTGETAAREVANKYWLRDKGRERMIGYGGPAI